MWIPETARQGWLIITRDRHIQDRRAEIEAARSSGARMINLAGEEAVNTFTQLEVLMCQWRNAGQEGRITVSVNGLPPAACATASFPSFLTIAASFAAGRPVDLSAVVTSSLGWAHARRVAEAVMTTDGPSRSFSQPCPAARQMKNTQLCGCPGGGPGRTRAAGVPL